MTLCVRELQGEDLPARRALLERAPDAMVYASPEFAAFLAEIVPGRAVCLGAFDGDELRGLLPYFVARDPALGSVVNSLPWYGSHGGCTLADPGDESARSALLEAYAGVAREPDTALATLIATPHEEARRERYARLLGPDLEDGRVGQVSALPASSACGAGEDGAAELEERLLRSFGQKTRNLVRKSLKQGFTVREADDDAAWAFLVRVHAENMAAIGGRAKPASHFEALRSRLPAAWRRLLLALQGDEPVAALLLLHFRETVEYLTPVVRVEHRSAQPLSFLIFHAMRDAARAGLRWWNWGGTWASQRSLHHFKAGWGALDRPYGYFVHARRGALDALRADLPRWQAAFPWYYLAPFDAL